MSCRTVCGRISVMPRQQREVTVIAAVSGQGRQAYLLTQQQLLRTRLAMLSITEQTPVVNAVQAELRQLEIQLASVS